MDGGWDSYEQKSEGDILGGVCVLDRFVHYVHKKLQKKKRTILTRVFIQRNVAT